MAAWRRPWMWWLWLWWSVAIAVVPEGDGGRQEEPEGRWMGGGPQCPSGCSCSLPRQVSCRAADGDIYPPHPAADTTHLVLEDYQVVPTFMLARLKNLRHLQITGSQLDDLTSLPSLPHLEVLNLQSNAVGTLGGGHLQVACPDLTHLLLAHNHLTVLNDTDLAGLNRLSVLDLSYNPLATVGTEALQGLAALTSLNVSRSKLPQLPHKWLIDTPQLHYLNISGTAVQQIPRLVGPSLGVVDASHNGISQLPDGLVEGAGNLRELLLHHNPLTHVTVTVLTGGSNLTYLDLHHTRLVNMDELVFQVMPKLRELRLDHNPRLKRIEHGAFTGLHNLRHLGLSHTPSLDEIEEVAFAGLPKLHSIDLRDSGLSVLPRSLTMLNHNTSVFLAGTALRCDCYNSWLPDLLISSDISTWNGVDPIQCRDGEWRTVRQLAALMASLRCAAPESVTLSNEWVTATKTQGALLECNITAHPPHKILWFSASHKIFRHNNSDGSDKDEWLSHQLQEAEHNAMPDPRFQVLESGHLLIREVWREDMGWYKCFAYNSVGNTSVMTFLTLSDASFRALYVESLLFGFACAALFFFITLLVQLINYLMDRLGCECCCCKDRISPKARQMKRLLESVESYKTQQLDRLRENYNGQVVSIKESCYQQMERIRESYTYQGKNLKELRDYSTQGITSLGNQYVDQVNKVRDYSMSQMNRVRENYVFQRHRIRKFSAHQLLRLRETYKYQQKTLNKILENLPDLYLQNCRTGGCQRSDSLIFDDTLHGIDAYYKVDFLDAQSHHSSDYYTPASTLTRSYRSTRGQEPVRQQSCTSSNISSEFMEAQLSLRRESSTVGSSSPSHTLSGHGHSHHSRSLSVASPATYVPDPVRVHKRSLSACHTSHKVAPETRGVPATITLREEGADGHLAPLIAPRSVPTTPTHFTRRRVMLEAGEGVAETHSTNKLQQSASQDQHSPNNEKDNKLCSESASEDTKASSDSNNSGSQDEESPQTPLTDESASDSSAFETSL